MPIKKIITVIGARPQIIKAAAISRAISSNYSDKLMELIVHTGQHYDENMSEVFFNELGIPRPAFNLNVGSGSHGSMTAKMLEGLESLFQTEKPDAVLVYGDTNSTIAAALAAAKIYIPVIHVEAGLRSFNKAMPEELNRIACDHMSSLLFSPTKAGMDNLKKEGFDLTPTKKASIDLPNVYHCGDVMYDNSLFFSELSEEKSTVLTQNELTKNQFILCTIHRDTNTDNEENLNAIFSALLRIQKESNLEIILPIHPRTKKKMEELLSEELLVQMTASNGFKIIPPAGFLDIISLEKNARIIITDSGGLQKEAFFFQKPCVILREQTEWIEIVENGNARLAGSNEELIVRSSIEMLEKTDFSYPNLFGDGQAASFICEKIMEELLC
ncbi:MAG: UDP-N-acetylglucosamine 2-epimerase (non-hydrolyzing) [Flavobacteriia bacterium]